MKQRLSHRVAGAVLAIVLISTSTFSHASFFSIFKQKFSASAALAGTPSLTISALPLANQLFSGKHFVIPVQVLSGAGTLSTNNLRIDVVYQLFDASGNSLTAPAVAPVQFLQVDPNNPARITGTAYIQRADLSPIQLGGQLKYFFRVLQGASGVYLGGGTAGTAAYPTAETLSALLVKGYSATVVTTFDSPVNPAGSASYVPDTFETDGLTGLQLEPGAVPNAGTLRIENLNVSNLPSGPAGSRAVVAYNFSLLGTTLQKAGQIVLTYPADLDGQIADKGGSPNNLAPYWWDGVNWRLLARPKIDTTLHTVTAYLPPPTTGSIGKTVVASTQGSSLGLGEQFEGSFALFATGIAPTAADLRPAERIITPNGDGINDVATFSGLIDGDVVHIFSVRGRRVRTIHANNTTATQWDGRDDEGSIVESGVYVYQYVSQGSRVSGVIAVAK